MYLYLYTSIHLNCIIIIYIIKRYRYLNYFVLERADKDSLFDRAMFVVTPVPHNNSFPNNMLLHVCTYMRVLRDTFDRDSTGHINASVHVNAKLDLGGGGRTARNNIGNGYCLFLHLNGNDD